MVDGKGLKTGTSGVWGKCRWSNCPGFSVNGKRHCCGVGSQNRGKSNSSGVDGDKEGDLKNAVTSRREGEKPPQNEVSFMRGVRGDSGVSHNGDRGGGRVTLTHKHTFFKPNTLRWLQRKKQPSC